MKALQSNKAHYITVGEKRLPLIIAKHARARHMVVRYDPQAQCVRLTLPRYVSVKRGLEFAQSREGWVERQLASRPLVRFGDGSVIPLFGRQVRLVHTPGRGVAHWQGDALHVSGDIAFMKRRVEDAIRKELRARVQDMAAHYAQALGVTVASIKIADTRSRWGSCSSKGALSLCFRLAFAPLEVLDYVVCHEVVHIKHLNHSTAFWKQVEALCPDVARHEAWLKAHGAGLWVYG